MKPLTKLEILKLEQNLLLNDVFYKLADMVRYSTVSMCTERPSSLKELNLASNNLSKFPEVNSGFLTLELLNLVENSFSNEDNLKGLTKLQALKQVLIWGNPVRRKVLDLLADNITFTATQPVPEFKPLHFVQTKANFEDISSSIEVLRHWNTTNLIRVLL